MKPKQFKRIVEDDKGFLFIGIVDAITATVFSLVFNSFIAGIFFTGMIMLSFWLIHIYFSDRKVYWEEIK